MVRYGWGSWGGDGWVVVGGGGKVFLFPRVLNRTFSRENVSELRNGALNFYFALC